MCACHLHAGEAETGKSLGQASLTKSASLKSVRDLVSNKNVNGSWGMTLKLTFGLHMHWHKHVYTHEHPHPKTQVVLARIAHIGSYV